MLRLLDLRPLPPGASLDLGGARTLPEGPVEQVRAILAEVAARGDAALRELTLRFDKVAIEEIRIAPSELTAAFDRLAPDLRNSLALAKDRIEAFHRHRAPDPGPFEQDGIRVRRLELAVERAGIYVPGGRARYPSSVLMTALPARVAGVGAIACCVPPGPDGSVPDEVLAAAYLAGVDELYRVGGAQAIGALAYGTESIEKVDVIVGPGNAWVSTAQREVRGLVGVPPAYAGPSEIVIVADETTPADWAAIDLVVQAEHGPDGLAWLVTWSQAKATEILEALERLVAATPRAEEVRATLQTGGRLALVNGPEQAMAVVNAVAPEHLELLTATAEELLPLVRNAGAIFIGPLAPASIGDYLAGPSHVLPTSATARFASVLGVEDFLRRVNVIEVSKAGLEAVAPHVAAIAAAEGLVAHAESVLTRTGRPTWSAS